MKSNPTQAEIRAHLAAMRALAGHPALDDGPEPKPRARPVQYEAAAARELVVRASRCWWGRYLTHHEAATASAREGRRNRAHGQRRGWPDYTLIVPWEAKPPLGLLSALELKAERHRPKRPVRDNWWLGWAIELDADRSWETRPNSPTRYGVSAEQAICLWELSRAGFATKVAYGASEAFEWLSALCGEG